MINTGKRALIDVAVTACTGLEASEGFCLIATNGPFLGAVGVKEVVRGAVDSGKLYRTSQELATDGAGVQVLVLVNLINQELSRNAWILDGWSLIARYGEGIDLRGAYLRGAQLRGARLKSADLRDADLCGANLEKADLSYADLTGANLAGSNLFSASLQGADLTEAELCRADLRHAVLREAICVRTAFRGADLWGTYTRNVDISHAFTAGADFTRSGYLLNEKVG